MNEIFRIWAAGITALLMIGCGGESEIKTYRVAKEDSHTHAVSASAAAAGAMSQQRPNIPHIHGDAAQGWEEMQPEKMRVASYRIAGDNGKSAELAAENRPENWHPNLCALSSSKGMAELNTILTTLLLALIAAGIIALGWWLSAREENAKPSRRLGTGATALSSLQLAPPLF